MLKWSFRGAGGRPWPALSMPARVGLFCTPWVVEWTMTGVMRRAASPSARTQAGEGLDWQGRPGG